MMKAICNLLFLIIMVATFSPLKAMGDCHETEKVQDECHHCHDEKTEESQNEQNHKQGHKDCEMACCHMAFVEINPVQIIIFEPQMVTSNYPAYLGKDLCDYREELLRPPIA